MQAVWKETLSLTVSQGIEVPEGAKMLHAGLQGGLVCVWFQCDPEAPKTVRTILMVGTGHKEVSDNARYLGTVLLHGGSLVLHIFERP
jgi:hypothetical protein